MTIREIALGHAGRPGALLPAPTRDPGPDGELPDTAVPVVVEVLNLSRAELVIHDNRGEVQLSTVTKQRIAPLPAPQ
ncbi:MAG: hypothetical protein O6700_02480 [Gammaproteobacteria bacterium]|nr:hypothetical protein [Gammaproteobacteria bacterium]MCZ6497359.1 hypothetical protein [Gammaproteobacteria bacterium]